MNARLVVGATFAFAWGVLVLATAIYDNGGPPAQLVQGAAANPDGLRVSAALNLVYALSMSLFAVGLAAVIRGRGAWAALAAACASVVGMIGVASEGALGVILSGMVQSQIEQATLIALVERTAGNVLPLILLAGFGIMVGPLIVMIAMWRAGRVPIWVPPLYVVAVASNMVNVPVTVAQLFASVPVVITAFGIARGPVGADRQRAASPVTVVAEL